MVSRYAVIEGGQCVNVILWDGDPKSWTPPAGITLAPFNPAIHSITVPIDVQNAVTLLDRARQALTTNATYLALASPSTAQSTAQVKALTRQVDGLIRLLAVNDTSTITDS